MQIPWLLPAVSKKFLVSLNSIELFTGMCIGPMENILYFDSDTPRHPLTNKDLATTTSWLFQHGKFKKQQLLQSHSLG